MEIAMGTLRPHIPNAVTLMRFPLSAGFALCHFMGMPLLGLVLATAGCLTDWLDGYLARRWNVTSDFGKIADAYADKFICWILTAIAFSILGPQSLLIALTVIIFAYDVGLTFLRYILGHLQIKVSWYAKAKTTGLMAGLLLVYANWLLLMYVDWYADAGYALVLPALANLALFGAGILALMSIGNYLRGYKLERWIPYPINLII